MTTNPKEQFTLKWQIKFVAMICFTGVLFLMKVTTGQVTRSMALVADSFHMITDFAALTIGFIALRVANSRTSSIKMLSMDRFTFGWVRAEVLGGLINTVFLLALCFSVLVEALKRFVYPEHITKPIPVLVVGCVSLLVNFLGLLMFRTHRENCWKLCTKPCDQDKKGDVKDEVEVVSLMNATSDEDRIENTVRKRRGTKTRDHTSLPTWESEYRTPHSLNIRGVYLHILEHFLASIIVIVSALLNMGYKGESWVVYIDPAFTVMVVATILYSTVPLFRETLILFMQSVPANIKVEEMEQRLLREVPEVLSVHEFHVWHLGGDKVVASAHLLYKTIEEFHQTVDIVKAFFGREGINCMTFQPEFLPADILVNDGQADILTSYSTSKCYFRCVEEDCVTMTCCAVKDGDSSSNDHTEECSLSPDVVSLASLTAMT